jgi:hypothetical protein
MVDKQLQIDRLREELISNYPALWQKIITGWKSPGPDRAMLMYSANYLFHTGNIKWALDPLTLHWRLKVKGQGVDPADLQGISFIILTHRHEDHLDLDLLSALKDSPITWVVPDYLLPLVTGRGVISKNIIVPAPLCPFMVEGIKITSFNGLHTAYEAAGISRGVPAAGYLVEFNGKRWLFPGDTRNYDASQLPDFNQVDGVFAHLWMGRGCALIDPPPLLESFCRFIASWQPDRVVITHLMEFGRNAVDYWDVNHARKAISFFQANYPLINASYATIGQTVFL